MKYGLDSRTGALGFDFAVAAFQVKSVVCLGVATLSVTLIWSVWGSEIFCFSFLLKNGNFELRRFWAFEELYTCGDRYRSTDRAHPSRELALGVRSLDDHWSPMCWYDILRPIFCVHELVPRRAFCRTRTGSCGRRHRCRRIRGSTRRSPSRDCRQRCSLSESGRTCDCSQALHTRSRGHVLCKH